MNGLCGWAGYGKNIPESHSLLASMARPLRHVPSTPSVLMAGPNSSLALVSAAPLSYSYQGERVLCALAGRPQWRDPALVDLAASQGFAKSVVIAFRDKGTAILELLSGAFSLAMLFEDDNEFLLAIDRMGTHTLTYTQIDETIIFGTTADSINLHPLASPQIDTQSIFNYVYFHMIPGPGTIYQHQCRLSPGTYLHGKNGHISNDTYWVPRFKEVDKYDPKELKSEFLTIMRESVRDATHGYDAGAFLSGGTDSSTVAGMLCDVLGKPARTYSIGFDAAEYDEMEYARIAAKHFGTSHHEYYVTPDDVVDAIPKIAAAYDQPFGNASAVPTYYCAKMAREDGIEVMLGGDGGDELFGGNERYAKQHLFSIYSDLPQGLRKGLIEPVIGAMPGTSNITLLRKMKSYIDQASVPMPGRMETYNLLHRLGIGKVFNSDFLADIDQRQPLSQLEQVYGSAHAESMLNRMLAVDLKFTLADNDLPKVVRTCEMNGIEVTFPMLNDALMAFSERLPTHQKLKGTQLRYFFKQSLRGFLPESIINKQKHGFGLPFGIWLQTHKPLKDLAYASLHDLKSRNIIRSDFIDSLTGKHLESHAAYYGTMVWLLMMLEQWFQSHSVAQQNPVQYLQAS